MKILSIDGGGIRGIIPAMMLAEIEGRTGKRIWEMFDLIAGTSTGGLLALGLVAPDFDKNPRYSIEQIIEVYRCRGREIFYEPPIESQLKVDDLLRPKYSSIGRKQVIRDMLGREPLNKALTNILIPAYDIAQRVPVFFSNSNKRGKSFEKVCSGFTMAEAAMATTAAPTLFEPYRVGNRVFVDGGVFANNPSAIASSEATTLSNREDILLVSLGTGHLTRKYSYEQSRNWGLVNWLDPLINIMLDGTSESVAIQIEYSLQKSQHYRFQVALNHANDALDDCSVTNIQNLKVLAQESIAHNTRKIDELCVRLINH
ncbi:patatin-like phospholipase family protein [Microcoleus sp. A006_D1]|uniref:patatin-like phospholipase family protein n=1 Tax=Microcoleus sp. A006_D1 TaxID=3055267 RepID=UPI002FD33937